MFIHLNVHSNHSLCRGASTIEAICRRAAELGMPALALTERDNFYGLIWFLEEARETGIQPIIGAEVTAPDGRAVLLAKNRRGYSTICRAISCKNLDEHFSLSRYLLDNHKNIVILSDDRELLSTLAREAAPRDLYAELAPGPKRHGLLKFARHNNLPVAATNNVHFLRPADFHIHRVLRAIDLNTTMNGVPTGELASTGAYFKTEDEMRAAFPDAPEALENTVRIAEDCRFEFHLGTFVFPEFSPPEGMDAFDHLRQLCYEGAKWRYGQISPEVRARMEKELQIIQVKGYATYFLVVHDIVKQSPRTCGRGSAAASLASYCLGITHVDPVKYDLFFERFLNMGRKDPPDIDVDFAWDERDDILDYVFERYGAEHTAMIANHVTFKARAALREVAKVYGLPAAEIKDVTRRISWMDSGPVSDMVEKSPMFRGEKLRDPWPEIMDLARRIHGFPRHVSVHCGGVVITPDPVENYVPVEMAPKGVRIINWEKDQAEEFGLVKIDLLGNRSLAVIRDALAGVRENTETDIDYAIWDPLDDPATQEIICRGDTMGVFYVESPAMRQLQRKAKTGDFEHLVIHSSIIRPAANTFNREYLARLHGAPFTPLHPALGDILQETYGVMCYQEDVSKVAMALAGFSASEADELRKIMSKKHKEKYLQDYCQKFYQGARANGVSHETVAKIWEMILSFSGYSFCKPHSASYALVSFKSAFLRSHFPAEFMAAVISNQGGYYSAFAYISEARRMGLKVLPPCVNASRAEYTGRDRSLRVGLMQLKGLTRTASEELLAVRSAGGPYRSFDNFMARTSLDPSDVRILIKAGAFDAAESQRTRPDLMWQLHFYERHRRDGRANSLFAPDPGPLPHAENYDIETMLRHETETLGFLISRHPLALYKKRLASVRYIPGKEMERHIGKVVNMVGWYITGKVMETKREEPMEFISFEDTTAIYETTFFPKVYAKFCRMMTATRPYLLSGKVEEDFGVPSLTVRDVRFL